MRTVTPGTRPDMTLDVARMYNSNNQPTFVRVYEFSTPPTLNMVIFHAVREVKSENMAAIPEV